MHVTKPFAHVENKLAKIECSFLPQKHGRREKKSDLFVSGENWTTAEINKVLNIDIMFHTLCYE